mmetsp:Transcript_94650/g.282679  ORF Transcript_94650/g.282679 Transcript_94650/m.282679 type:complete len:200 (-) Transcript_94650:649-1248(-)
MGRPRCGGGSIGCSRRARHGPSRGRGAASRPCRASRPRQGARAGPGSRPRSEASSHRPPARSRWRRRGSPPPGAGRGQPRRRRCPLPREARASPWSTSRGPLLQATLQSRRIAAGQAPRRRQLPTAEDLGAAGHPHMLQLPAAEGAAAAGQPRPPLPGPPPTLRRHAAAAGDVARHSWQAAAARHPVPLGRPPRRRPRA